MAERRQQGDSQFLARVPLFHTEIMIMPDRAVLHLDMVRPLKRQGMVGVSHGILGDRRHEGFKVEMMDWIPDGLKGRLQVRTDPFQVGLHPLLHARKLEVIRNVVDQLDPLLDELVEGSFPSR